MSITLSKQTSVYRQVDAILKRKIYTAETSTRCSISHTTKSKQSRCVPGWTAEHSLARDRSLFWYRLWISNDNQNIDVSLIMRCTRSKYHYMVRKLKRTRDTQIRVSLGKALLLNGNRDYSRELKKIREKNEKFYICYSWIY